MSSKYEKRKYIDFDEYVRVVFENNDHEAIMVLIHLYGLPKLEEILDKAKVVHI